MGIFRLFAVATCLLFFQTPPSHAQEAPAGEPGTVVTPEATAVLERMRSYLGGLTTFSVRARTTRDEVLNYGYKLQHNETVTAVVQRPDRMLVQVDGDIKNRLYIYDGKTLTMSAPELGVYARTPAPATIRAVLSGLVNAGVEMPLIDVLGQAADGRLLDGVKFGLLVGESTVDGEVTDHLAFRQPTIDWQLWVAKNGQPRKLLITTRYSVAEPQYQANLEWDTSPDISEKTFQRPPGEAREIPFVFAEDATMP